MEKKEEEEEEVNKKSAEIHTQVETAFLCSVEVVARRRGKHMTRRMKMTVERENELQCRENANGKQGEKSKGHRRTRPAEEMHMEIQRRARLEPRHKTYRSYREKEDSSKSILRFSIILRFSK